MLNAELFKKAKLAEPERCCAALRNNHRCANANGSLGENLICDVHAEKLSQGEWVRLYKESKFESSALGIAFASLRQRLSADRDEDEKGTSEHPTSEQVTPAPPETSQTDLPGSWFSHLLSPQALGTVLFLAAVYVAEMIKLRVIDAPGSLTLSNAESFSLAITNGLSVVIFILLTLFWTALIVGLVLPGLFFIRRAFYASEVWLRSSLPSFGLRTLVSGRTLLTRTGLAITAGLPEGLSPRAFDRAQAVDLAMRTRDLVTEQIHQDFRIKATQLRAKEEDRRHKLLAYLSRRARWYHDALFVKERSGPQVNAVQAITLASLFCAAVASSWIGATQFNQALNLNLCTRNASAADVFDDLREWWGLPIASYGYLNPHIGSVDCGYLVFERRRENLSSVLSPGIDDHKPTDGTQGLYSEQVAYIGDYGEWSLVVPASRPTDRVLIRRSAIQEFASSEPVNGLMINHRQATGASPSSGLSPAPAHLRVMIKPDGSIGRQEVSRDPFIALLVSSGATGVPTDTGLSGVSEFEDVLKAAEALNLNMSKTIGDFGSLIEKLHQPITVDVRPRLVPAEVLEKSDLREILFPNWNGPINLPARIALTDEPFETSHPELSAVLNAGDDSRVLDIPSRLELPDNPFRAPQDTLADLLNNTAEASPLQLSTQLRIDSMGVNPSTRSQDPVNIGNLQANLSIDAIEGLRSAMERVMVEPFKLTFEQSDWGVPETCSELRASVYFQVGSYNTLEARHRSSNLDAIEGFIDQIDSDDFVILRGYTDPVGPASSNLDLAERRAEDVRDVLSKRFPKATVQIGTMPIGAQTSEQLWSGLGNFSDVTDAEMRRVDLLSCSSSEVFAGDPGQ